MFLPGVVRLTSQFYFLLERWAIMIDPGDVEDWVHEIEERPQSAAGIIRAIAARLVELEKWNSELLKDNITLRDGSRVNDYEGRIAALENQLEMLKRQPGPALASKLLPGEGLNLVLFHPRGQVVRLPFDLGGLSSGAEIARFSTALDPQLAPGMFFAGSKDELLFVYDSGRTVQIQNDQIRAVDGPLDWGKAQRVSPRPGEEMVAVQTITRLALFEYCAQISRRACAKLMPKSGFQSALARGSIGAGVKRRPDKTAGLVLCARDDFIVAASYEGYLLRIQAGLLPYTVDEILQLGVGDHLVSVFNTAGKSEMLIMTNTGKAVRRDFNDLEEAASYRSHGKAAFSAARRESGVRIAGAAGVSESDWGAVLRADGSLCLYRMDDLFASGAVETGEGSNPVLSFCVFGSPR
jgi:DNA gyrase/topoisomerase IV subunit A